MWVEVSLSLATHRQHRRHRRHRGPHKLPACFPHVQLIFQQHYPHISTAPPRRPPALHSVSHWCHRPFRRRCHRGIPHSTPRFSRPTSLRLRPRGARHQSRHCRRPTMCQPRATRHSTVSKRPTSMFLAKSSSLRPPQQPHPHRRPLPIQLLRRHSFRR